jgi:hypothetical protein
MIVFLKNVVVVVVVVVDYHVELEGFSSFLSIIFSK